MKEYEMKSRYLARGVGAFTLLAGLLVAALPASAGDLGDFSGVCPASIHEYNAKNCVMMLENDDFEMGSPGSLNTDRIWRSVPGWNISAPVPMYPIWQGGRFVGVAVGPSGGQSISQTIHAPVLGSSPGMPLPTYHFAFAASTFGTRADGRLTARLIGVADDGSETELTSLSVSPTSSTLEEFMLRASPRGKAPVRIRVEFIRTGGDQPIYVDDVGVALTFDR